MVIIDELKLALLLNQVKTILSQKGTIRSITCALPNSCSLMAIEKIRQSFNAVGLTTVEFVPQGLCPFVYMENFDPETKKFMGYEKKHVIVDVTSGEINFNFGKANRKEKERKVELTKWKTSRMTFDNIREKMKEILIEKCKAHFNEKFTENDFNSALKNGEIDEKVEQIIVQLFNDDMESTRVQFVTDEEPLAIEIETKEICEQLKDIIQAIIDDLKEFMSTIKVKGFIDFVGRYSRFVPLRKTIVETTKAMKWKERYVLDCENIKSVGASFIGKLKETL